MLWLHSVSCHHGDHGEPGSWIYSNKLVCTNLSKQWTHHLRTSIHGKPTTSKKGFQQHLTKVRLPKKQNLSPSCIRHACIAVSSLMSNSMYCATSIQKPFMHIDSERIVQFKCYNQMGWSINITTSHRHHFPSTPLPFVTTLSHSFLFFCYILLLYCDVMYHPSS